MTSTTSSSRDCACAPRRAAPRRPPTTSAETAGIGLAPSPSGRCQKCRYLLQHLASEGVIRPDAALRPVQNTGIDQNLQMVRDRGLPQADRIDEIADAGFVAFM